jgi:hypothetical protein
LAHTVQLAAPEEEYVPGTHEVQLPTPLPAAVPGAHAAQLSALKEE